MCGSANRPVTWIKLLPCDAIAQKKTLMNKRYSSKGLIVLGIVSLLMMLGQSTLYAVKSGKAVKGAKNEQATKKLPAISPAVVAKFEKKAKHAIVFSAIGLALLIGVIACLLYTSPSPRDATLSRMPSSA